MVVDLKNKKIINKFHEYVTPSYNPNLTPFCTELTGITQ
jgi:inhibitor of KinA sporulation pathway (predicted exonuclease)